MAVVLILDCLSHANPPHPLPSPWSSSERGGATGTALTRCSSTCAVAPLRASFSQSLPPSPRSNPQPKERGRGAGKKELYLTSANALPVLREAQAFPPVKDILFSYAKTPTEPLIEIDILSEEVSPRPCCTNRVVISLGLERLGFFSHYQPSNY